MRSIAPGALVACGGLVFALLVPHALAPAAAQEQTGAQTLIERLQQIQEQLERGPAQPMQGPTAHADALIRQIEVIQQQSRADAATDRQPELGEEEVRRLVRDGLGVDVLRAELVEQDGHPVYALTVMNPAGNDNAAFMVRTLLVDGATGGLLGEVPHTPRAAAPHLTQGAPAAGPDGGGLEIRRRTFR